MSFGLPLEQMAAAADSTSPPFPVIRPTDGGPAGPTEAHETNFHVWEAARRNLPDTEPQPNSKERAVVPPEPTRKVAALPHRGQVPR